MMENETTEKELAYASLNAATELIHGVAAGLTINAMRTRMERVAHDLIEAIDVNE